MTILRRCKSLKSDLQRLDLRVRQADDALRAIGGMRMDANGGGKGTADMDRTGKLVAELDEMERAKKDREDAGRAEIASAVMLLRMVPDLESEILHRYYLLGETISGIAVSMKYEQSYVRKRKKAGEEAMGYLSAERVAETLPAWYLKKWEEN